jgi:hypothetical protein
MKKFFGILAGTVFGIVIVIAAWHAASETSSGSADIHFINATCSIPANAASANYSATIVAKKDYASVVLAAKALITKYNGDSTSWSEDSQNYQADSGINDTTFVTSTNISTNIPLGSADAFMSDFTALVTGSDTIQNPNYSKTDNLSLVQNCNDDLNSLNEAESLVRIYMDQVPSAVENYSSTVSNTDPSYPSGSQNTIDALNQEIENQYSDVSSYNDSITQTVQSANKLQVSITINATDTPQSYYSPEPTYNDGTSDSSQYQ